MCLLGGHRPPIIMTLGTVAIWTSRPNMIWEVLDRINRQYWLLANPGFANKVRSESRTQPGNAHSEFAWSAHRAHRRLQHDAIVVFT
jgi:hypothetical protein